MKETVSANIGGQAFTLDKDAYERLSDYLADVRSRVNDPTGEIMTDIESGIADIFSQTLSSAGMVVTILMVEATIARMGIPDDFGPKRTKERCNNGATQPHRPLHCGYLRRYCKVLQGRLFGYSTRNGTTLPLRRLIILGIHYSVVAHPRGVNYNDRLLFFGKILKIRNNARR